MLVYRECPEGCWCATGEGHTAPLCGPHSQPMMPGRSGEPESLSEIRRLGFAALFGYEAAMVHLIGRARQLLGFVVPLGDGRWGIGGHTEPVTARYYSQAEISAELTERGWDGQKWPEAVDRDA